MLAQAIHASAGVGVGTFLGVFAMLWMMKRSGRDVPALRGSVFFTALVAAMAAWVLVAVMKVVLG